jgi:hypothetical protein
MDVHCSTCEEPWDVVHLREDEIFDADLTEEVAIAWQSLPPAQQLGDRYRAKFRANGWEFGSTVINVIRCPACPKDATANPETLAIKAALEDLLGDDEDALAVTFEDHHL